MTALKRVPINVAGKGPRQWRQSSIKILSLKRFGYPSLRMVWLWRAHVGLLLYLKTPLRVQYAWSRGLCNYSSYSSRAFRRNLYFYGNGERLPGNMWFPQAAVELLLLIAKCFEDCRLVDPQFMGDMAWAFAGLSFHSCNYGICSLTPLQQLSLCLKQVFENVVGHGKCFFIFRGQISHWQCYTYPSIGLTPLHFTLNNIQYMYKQC
jgi:hypothetical protein